MERKADAIDEHCHAFYLEIPGEDVVLFQAFFELGEGIGIVRTLNLKRSLVCVLTTPDMVESCLKLLDSIAPLIPWRLVERPVEAERQLYLGYFSEKSNA